MNAIEPYRYFVTPTDVAAMDWIANNTPPDARFAINTFFWLPNFPHGTDGGYWIPYFTGRQTTTGPMLFQLGRREDSEKIIALSRAVKRPGTDDAALTELRSSGVSYIYIGAKGNLAEPGLDSSRLVQSEDVTLVYRREGVSIFQVNQIVK